MKIRVRITCRLLIPIGKDPWENPNPATGKREKPP
jgi:hypothetical protein